MLTAANDQPTGTTTSTEEFDRLTASLRTRGKARRAIVEAVIVVVLLAGGGLLAWGGGFAKDMVHDQLADQKISFPAKGSPALDPATYPGLQRYAGQLVDSGPKAKAYANEYIKVHLAETADGQTYSQVSEASRAAPTDTKLAGEVQTLFRGETLRGLLLYAWGWSVVGVIALYAAWGMFLLAGVVGTAFVYAVARPEHA
jgi:hypothetical protein